MTDGRRVTAAIGIYVLVLAGVGTVLGTWTDEEYTLATTAHGFAYAWHRALDYEVQAPLYFAIVALWREANASVWFARLFSVGCAGFFFWALLWIGRRVAPERDPFAFAAILACNPFVIWAALEIRLYMFALLLSALLWLAIDAGFAHGRDLRARIAFVALAVVALYTQYFLGFFIMAYAVVLAAKRRWRALGLYALALCVVGIAILPLLAYLHSQVGVSSLSRDPLAVLLRDALAHPWMDFVFPYEGSWDRWHVRWPYLACVAFLIALGAFARPRLGGDVKAALLAAASVEFTYLLVVLVVRLGLHPRHYVALFLPLMVAAYTLVIALARSRPRLATGFVAIHVALAGCVLATTYHALAKSGDARRVGPFLTAASRRGDAIAIFPADALPVYRRTYHGAVPLSPFPSALPKNRYDEAALVVYSESQAADAFHKLGADGKHVWLIIEGNCDPKHPFDGCDHIVDAARKMHILAEYDFYQSQLLELEIRGSSGNQRTRS